MYHIDRGAWAEINLDAVAHNVQIAKKNLAPATKLCAVVKADAYGHGAVAIAREAEKNGADFLAVALLQEGLELREAGISLPILVLGSLQPAWPMWWCSLISAMLFLTTSVYLPSTKRQ